MLRLLALCCLLLVIIPSTEGLIHNLNIRSDKRGKFFIENFGFELGGNFSLSVKNFKVEGATGGKAAFVIKISEADASTFFGEEHTCVLDSLDEDDIIVVKVKDESEESSQPDGIINLDYNKIIREKTEEGLYNTFFVNCLNAPVSFDLDLVQYNVDGMGRKVYLSAGFAQLPTLYGVFSAAYVAMFVIWVFGFMRGPGKKVNRVHYLMTVLVVLYALSLFFQAMELHFTKVNGKAGGWLVPYFIFAGLRTVFFFVLIALIGTGWTFVKPFLSEKDKKIIMFVIPLQILDNVAMVIVDTLAPGSQGWLTWKDIFRLVDIICCGAVLIPIIWSIKHLREASQIDGKVARNLQKLKLFRQFYLIVVSYIYFTRIIIFLLDATLPFRLVWMGEMFSELATLSFFAIVGYKFSPAEDNPYFKIDVDDDAVRLEEMAKERDGLDD